MEKKKKKNYLYEQKKKERVSEKKSFNGEILKKEGNAPMILKE